MAGDPRGDRRGPIAEAADAVDVDLTSARSGGLPEPPRVRERSSGCGSSPAGDLASRRGQCVLASTDLNLGQSPCSPRSSYPTWWSSSRERSRLSARSRVSRCSRTGGRYQWHGTRVSSLWGMRRFGLSFPVGRRGGGVAAGSVPPKDQGAAVHGGRSHRGLHQRVLAQPLEMSGHLPRGCSNGSAG